MDEGKGELMGGWKDLHGLFSNGISILTEDQHSALNHSCNSEGPDRTGEGRMADFTATLKSRVSALAENARELTLDFEAASGSRFFDSDEQTMKEIQTLLNGRLEREKLEALRRLIAVFLINDTV
jgi:hypothetical protein